MKKWLSRLGFGFLVALMLAGAIGHVVAPESYAPLVPPFIPLKLANWASFTAEASVGALLILPRTRKWGGLALGLLMLGFLPLHIWDLTKDVPFVGSTAAASFRLVIQLVLIWGGWRVFDAHR